MQLPSGAGHGDPLLSSDPSPSEIRLGADQDQEKTGLVGGSRALRGSDPPGRRLGWGRGSGTQGQGTQSQERGAGGLGSGSWVCSVMGVSLLTWPADLLPV